MTEGTALLCDHDTASLKEVSDVVCLRDNRVDEWIYTAPYSVGCRSEDLEGRDLGERCRNVDAQLGSRAVGCKNNE
jgi:hypothetical protein